MACSGCLDVGGRVVAAVQPRAAPPPAAAGAAVPRPHPPATVQRARELLSEGDQGGGGHGIKILLAALGAAPGLQALLADAVVHRDMARWTFKRSLLKCLEAAVLTTSDHRKEILANDGVGVIVRSCRWRPHEPGFRPKQEVRGAWRGQAACWQGVLVAAGSDAARRPGQARAVLRCMPVPCVCQLSPAPPHPSPLHCPSGTHRQCWSVPCSSTLSSGGTPNSSAGRPRWPPACARVRAQGRGLRGSGDVELELELCSACRHASALAVATRPAATPARPLPPGIERHGIAEVEGARVYAYEVDGLGGRLVRCTGTHRAAGVQRGVLVRSSAAHCRSWPCGPLSGPLTLSRPAGRWISMMPTCPACCPSRCWDTPTTPPCMPPPAPASCRPATPPSTMAPTLRASGRRTRRPAWPGRWRWRCRG